MKRRELAAWSMAAAAWGSLRAARAQTTAPSTTPSTSQGAPPAAAAGTSAPAAQTGAAQDGAKPFTAAQLDQMLAPIALYPDALLAQTLMAATYPLEVVEAARWSKDHASLNGDAALAAVKDKGWDVSVTSLVAFPQVLAVMDSKLDWTQKIGDAMIAQQSDVAASIQRLRAQAQSAGNLKSTPQQTVSSQPPSAGAPAGTPAAIVIEPANPDTVYVPSYNPSWAYGAWPYADNPPDYFPPPAGYGYGPGWGGGGWWGGGFSFGLGFAVGGAFFGGWNWGGGWGGGWGWGGWGGWGGGNSYTTINAERATHITNNFNRNNYHDGHWNHDPAHRDGVPYRDKGSRERYNQHHPDAAQRRAFRDKVHDQPRNSGLQGAGERGDKGNRGNEPRTSGLQGAGQRHDEGNRGNEGRGNEGRGNENHGQANRGTENRGNVHRSAFHGADHGHEVHHEAARGHSYANHAHYGGHRSSGGGHGGHGGGHGGRK
jgi:hypothetical protein